jgi:hypothetical protein
MRLVGSLFFFVAMSCFGRIGGTKLPGVRIVSEREQPAPLLTSDYGILKEADRYRDLRSYIPLLPVPTSYFFYWQCLPLNKVKFGCMAEGIAEPERGCKRNNCLPEIEVTSGKSTFTFMVHQMWCVESYRELKRELRELLRGHRVACFGAEYIGEDVSDERSIIRDSSWFLKRIRTAHGKWDYFAD